MNQLKQKQFFPAKILSVVFFFFLVCPVATYAAPYIDDPYNVDQQMADGGTEGFTYVKMTNKTVYDEITQKQNSLKATLDGIAANISEGKTTDWAAVASAYGLNQDLSPDEIYAGLSKAYNDLAGFTGAVSKDNVSGTYTFQNDAIKYHYIMQNLINNYVANLEVTPAVRAPAPVSEDDDTATSPVFYDVTAMLSALQAQIPQLIRFIKALSWLMGIFFVMAGVMKLKAYGQQTMMSSTHASMTGPLVYITIGSLLIYFPSIFFVVTETLMGGGDSVLSYTPGELSGFGFASLLAVVVAIVRLVGFIAFLKGWVILTKLGSQNGQGGTVGKGIVHIVGGVLAVNIITTWEILRATFGYVW